jgi:hypothetical protein
MVRCVTEGLKLNPGMNTPGVVRYRFDGNNVDAEYFGRNDDHKFENCNRAGGTGGAILWVSGILVPPLTIAAYSPHTPPHTHTHIRWVQATGAGVYVAVARVCVCVWEVGGRPAFGVGHEKGRTAVNMEGTPNPVCPFMHPTGRYRLISNML